MQKTNALNLETWRCQNLLDLIRGPLTNLTPNTITLDKATPISVPAYSDSSKVKFDMSKARGARLVPGGNITFDVFVAKDSMLEVSIDEVVIKSNQSNIDCIISAMNFTAQVSII